MTAVQSERPPVGTRLTCFFGANKYRGTVVSYGRKWPVVRFTLGNGKVKEGRATILPHGAPIGGIYVGYLAQLLPPEPTPPATPPATADDGKRPARTDVLLCVCGTTWKPKPGESLIDLAHRLGGSFYPSARTKDGSNYICRECEEL